MVSYDSQTGASHLEPKLGVTLPNPVLIKQQFTSTISLSYNVCSRPPLK